MTNKIEKEINDREWAKLLGSRPTGICIRPDSEGYMINNSIYVTKEAMEEILNWNEVDKDKDKDKDRQAYCDLYLLEWPFVDDDGSVMPDIRTK
jgi:hypothetical protein